MHWYIATSLQFLSILQIPTRKHFLSHEEDTNKSDNGKKLYSLFETQQT